MDHQPILIFVICLDLLLLISLSILFICLLATIAILSMVVSDSDAPCFVVLRTYQNFVVVQLRAIPMGPRDLYDLPISQAQTNGYICIKFSVARSH